MNVDWPRTLATLLLVVVAAACWRLARPAASKASATPSTAPKSKKRAKKRAKKASAEASSTPSATLAPPVGTPAAQAEDDDDDNEDEDDGLSAAQVLTRRKFHTTRALGASKAVASSQPSKPALPKFAVGQRVLARFQGGAEWFPATVLEVKRGNEYNLRYDDGEDEFRVSHKLLKAVVASPLDAGSQEQKKPVATDDRKPAVSEISPVLSSSDGGGDADESAADDANDDDDNANDDNGWEIVGATGSKAKGRAATSAAGSVGGAVVGTDGLTKRQRESRRKKERQREVKELARAQAQENGLHVRWGGTYSKMKYVPPPVPQ